ncbi:MAG: hypothetical protein IJW59_04905 [Clostridia bacterium]|nr:hypothetical protein [Clostridia bacterium]
MSVENNEIKQLIATFKEYRELLGPIEQSLRSFSVSFDGIKNDLQGLNSSIDGSVQNKLDKIYKELSGQAEKTKTLTSEVDRFLNSTNKYVTAVDSLLSLCGKIESRLNTVNNIESKAEEQISKLNDIIEEKRKVYDIKQLEKKLENYNVGVQKVSEFINKDVADVLQTSGDKISEIQDRNKSIYNAIVEEKGSIEKLVASYDESNKLLKKIVESSAVNEQYIFDILDKWAEDRKVKTKK